MNHTIGIDAHGNGIQYQIENAGGEPVAAGRFPKSHAGWLDFLEVFKARGIAAGGAAVFIEATGRHHLAWCERLHAEGFAVYQLNPLLTKRLYSAANAIRDNKTDRVDAATLCEIGRLHRAKLERFRYGGQSQKLQLQALVSARQALRNQCTNLLKSAGDLLDWVFPECKQVGLGLTNRGFRQLLLKAPTPGRIAKLPLESLHEAVGGKAEELRRAAGNSLTPESMARASSTALVEMLESIEAVHQKITNFDHAIDQAVRKFKEGEKGRRLIGSLPGFGKVTTAVIVAFLPEDFAQWVPGEKGRCKKKLAAKLQAHFGFDPRLRDSGQHKGKVKLSKRGVEPARTAFFQASFCSLNHDPQLRAYYDKKKAEGDHHTKAIIDVMRKNLRRMVSVLIEEKPFEFRPENA